MQGFAFLITLLQCLIDSGEMLNISWSLQGYSVCFQCFNFDLNRLKLDNVFKSAGVGDHR